jgi:hypothetical protein
VIISSKKREPTSWPGRPEGANAAQKGQGKEQACPSPLGPQTAPPLLHEGLLSTKKDGVRIDFRLHMLVPAKALQVLQM